MTLSCSSDSSQTRERGRQAPAEDVYVFPASFAQQRLWFLHQLEPDSAAYHIHKAVRLKGPLNVEALERSLKEIVRRHEILRTTFAAQDGEPVQIIGRTPRTTLPLIELWGLPREEREGEVLRLIAEEGRQPFDLTRGPLLRAKLLHVSEGDYVLMLTIHHIVFDGWSLGVLFRELNSLYESFATKKASSLPELDIQYADYAVWQRRWAQGEVLEKQLSYWKQRLGGRLPALEIPTSHPRPMVQTFNGARERLAFPRALSDELRALGHRARATLFMTLLAAFKALLHRYTNQEDVIVGSPIAGRTRPETEALIGFFVNTLVLRTSLSGDPTFLELLDRVRTVALGAYSHQELPFEKLVEELRPARDVSRTPLFQAMFALQNSPMETLKLSGLSVSPVEIESRTAKFDLTLSLVEADEGLRGWLEYNTDLFDAPTVKRMSQHFQTMLQSVVANPSQRLSRLPLLTQPELQQVLVDWNNTRRDYPRDCCVHELFEAQVERSPEAIALVYEDQQLTYLQLNGRANQLAHHLRKLGVGPKALVAVCAQRSPETVVAFLGILKAGGAYVPLDPDYPKERLAFMLEDSKAPVLLTQSPLLKGLPNSNAKIVLLDSDWEIVSNESRSNPRSEATAEDPAYVMYTSGSTGKPKGVEVSHRCVTRLLFGVDYVQLDANQSILQMAPISFDASTFEIWGALLHGGRCVLFPDRVPTIENLAGAIQRHEVSTLWLTASLFNIVIDEAPGVLSGMQQLLIGGEALSVTHVRRARGFWPSLRIINGYGPTEGTTFSCCYQIPEQLSKSNRSIPIGRPISNTQVYILDRNLQPVPVRVPGELYIGGDGLACGYLNLPELTAERFIKNPFNKEPGSRLYKTGDLARYLDDANIEFLGRIDTQVKIRGFRIELGEIVVAVSEHPAVREAVVVAREDQQGDKRLVAYVVPRAGWEASATELRNFLKQKLPECMLPSAFFVLDSLPLNPNGKLERHLLPAPDQGGPTSLVAYVGPRDDLELRLTKIWERVLGIQPIGTGDSFFDLGGHSLLAVSLFAQIKKVFGNDLPLATLFQAPTVQRLAKMLRETGKFAAWSSLAPIQLEGSRPPFFCIHGVGGNVLGFRDLARYLGADQPFYGLQSAGLDGKQAPYSRIENMATHYIEEIRSIQPEGPYYLGGASFGGAVAFEMARQLCANGQKVALLALFDTSCPGYSRMLPKRSLYRRKASQYARRARFHLDGLLFRPGKLAYLKAKMKTIKRRVNSKIWQLAYKFYKTIERPLPHALQKVREANYQALKEYVPRSYDGEITLFLAGERALSAHSDRELGWDNLARGGVRVHEVPGNHVTLTEEPHVRILAEKLRDCIDQAQVAQPVEQTPRSLVFA